MDLKVYTRDMGLLSDMYESKSISLTDSKKIPGNAILKQKPVIELKESSHAPQVLSFIIEFGIDVVKMALVAWLYDKLKKNKPERIVIDGKDVSLTKEDITKAVQESIDE